MLGFATAQPGPVIVDVQAQGAPVSVRLEGPTSAGWLRTPVVM